MKISLQHHAQHTLLMMGWFIVALAIPLTGQAMERQSVTVTVAPHGAYTLRGDQNAVAVRTQSDGLQVTYKSPAGLNLLSFIAFDGCLHLEQFEAHVCLLNTGATTGRVTALGKNIELAPGTSIDITGNPTQVTVVNTTSLRDSAAWAASDVYLNTLAETKVLGEAGKEAALLLESTYQAAFAEALQQKYSAQKAAQRAQDAVANLDLPQEITQAVDLLAETASSQIIAAAENMLKQASTVQVDGQRLAIGEAAQARAPISVSSQRFTLEPGQRGVVLVDTGFRPAVNGFSFTNYGGEYPHGDLTADDARIIFGAQACAAANTDECLASPAAYVWVSSTMIENGNHFLFPESMVTTLDKALETKATKEGSGVGVLDLEQETRRVSRRRKTQKVTILNFAPLSYPKQKREQRGEDFFSTRNAQDYCGGGDCSTGVGALSETYHRCSANVEFDAER